MVKILSLGKESGYNSITKEYKNILVTYFFSFYYSYHLMSFGFITLTYQHFQIDLNWYATYIKIKKNIRRNNTVFSIERCVLYGFLSNLNSRR